MATENANPLDVLSPEGCYSVCVWFSLDLDVHEPDPDDPQNKTKLVTTMTHFVVDAGRDVEGWWLKCRPYDEDEDDRPDCDHVDAWVVDVAGAGPLDPLTRLRAFLEGRVD
jgi:hypothetical protein